LDDLNQITISAWIKMNTLGASIFDKGWVNGKSFYVHDSGPLCFVQGFTSGPVNPWGWWRTNALLATGGWYFVSVTYDGTSLLNDPSLYIDGALASSYEGTTPTGTALSDSSYSGLMGGTVYYTNGVIDEVHVSNVIRSSAWITTEYNNQLSPTAFYAVGNEQRVTLSQAPVLADEYPRNGISSVAPNPALSVHARDFQSDLMTIIFSSNASGSWGELGRYTNVGEGTYNQTTIDMDSYSTTYYWRICATDGTNWTNKTFTFTTMPEPPPWWNYYWAYRKSVTADHTKVAGDLSSFPILVDVTDADLASKALSNGHDIAFADLNGYKLDHEIEKYESASGHLVAWVRLPTLSASVDTVFYMYYGNPSASNQQNPAGVWDSGFRMVQHLEESSGTCYDSTGNHNDGTPYGGVSQGVSGKTDGAASFDGNNGTCIDLGTASSLTNIGSITITAWIEVNAWPSYIFDKGFTGGKGFYVHDNGYLCFVQGFSNQYGWWRTSDATVSIGSWHYVAVTYDSTNTGDDPVLYIDGVIVPITEGRTPDGTICSDTAYKGFIGCNQTELGSRTLNGLVDEVRLSHAIRDSSWILTEYSNQQSPATFCAIGTEERVVLPQAPWLTDEQPSDEATAVLLDPTLSVHAVDFQSDLMTIIFGSNATGSWIELGRFTNVGNGTYTQGTSSMNSYSTTYYWKVSATDGTNWQNKTFTFTTRPENYVPTVSNPFPADESMGLPLNPLLAVDVSDGDGDSLTIIFSVNMGGTWQVLGTKTGHDGRYNQSTTGMNDYATTYQWRVSVTDGKAWTNMTYSFTTIMEEDLFTQIGFFACAGMPYPGRTTEKDTLRFIWFGNEYIYPWPPHGKEFILWYSDFNKKTGWVNGSLLDSSWLYNCTGSDIQVGCAHFAYFGGEYHVFFVTPPESGSAYLGYMHASNWSDLQSMTTCETLDPFQSVRLDIDAWGSAYAFNNSYAWNFFVYDYTDQGHTLVYWVWNETSGWSTMNPLWGTSTGLHDHYPHDCAGPVLLPINRTTWYLYYKSNIGGDHFNIMKSFDAGQTWTTPQIADIPQQPSWQSHRPSFVRYGDNFYMIVNVGGSDISCYNSSDGEHWGNLQTIHTGDWYAPSGTMLDQSHILWTASGLPYYPGTVRTGPEYGGVFKISDMIAYPGKPSNLYPFDGASLPEGTHSTRLQVTVHGSQTYDVAFYWANGTFIGEDKLLREGEIASFDVFGLRDGQTYQWHAVARGTTYGYWGNEPSSTSDENQSDTYAFAVEQGTPSIEMNPTSITCRRNGENFTVAVDISYSGGVNTFDFEIHYNATLLDYVEIAWPTWESGTVTIDELNGKITGSTFGTEISGNQTLMLIIFKANYNHVWKDQPGWANNLTEAIFFQWANLNYSDDTSRRFEKGGVNEFNMGPDFVYTFSPIRGDVDNDGNVDIFDLRSVAAYYDAKQGDPNWTQASTYDLNGDGTIDIFDLVIVATNHGYKYSP
jgi:hypothetical protein